MPKATTVKPKEPMKDRLRRLRTASGHTPSSLAHAVGVTEVNPDEAAASLIEIGTPAMSVTSSVESQ
jgi:hypothetical protein